MKRFLTTFALFLIGLVALATGVNVALERVGSSPSLGSVSVCNEHGTVTFAYSGDIENCRASIKSNAAPEAHFIHRT